MHHSSTFKMVSDCVWSFKDSFRMKYTLKKSTLTKLRAKLTKAINSGEAKKVLSTVEEAYKIFEKEGYPDDWSRWERAKEDFRPYKSDPYWVYDEQ